MKRGLLVVVVFVVLAPGAAAIDFSWQPIDMPPSTPVYSGNWSTVAHWDDGAFIPAAPADTANIGLISVPSYTVTLDLDTHIGAFSLNSAPATLDAVGRVFRVDGANDLLQGEVNWDSSQFLDSGAGTLTNEVTVNVTRTSLIDTATVVQKGTLNVISDAFNTTLTVTNGISSNRGLIDVNASTANQALLRLTSGPLINDSGGGMSGELRFSGLGNGLRRFEGDLNNTALVNVLKDASFSGIGDVVTNSGAFFIAPGATLKMQASTQVFNHNGNDLNVQGAFEGTGLTFNFNGGTVSSNAISLLSSTLNVGSGANDGAFVLRGTNTYSGDLKAVHVLTVRSDTGSTTVTAANGFANDGTLRIQSTSANTSRLNITSGAIVNQAAGIIDFNGTTGIQRFDGDLNNTGTVTVEGDTTFGKIGGVVNNMGQFTIDANATFTTGISQVWNQNSGTLDINGTFDPAFLTLNYNGGLITGNPMTMTQSSLNIGPGAGDGAFLLRSSSNLSGDLKAEHTVTVRSDTVNTTVTAANGFANSGTLRIQSTGTGNARLNIPNGTLVNQSGGLINFNGITGTRQFDGDLNNTGTVTVEGDTSFGKIAASISNAGAFHVAAGATLTMSAGGGQVFNQNAGTLDIDGTFDTAFATFNHNGGDITGTPITIALGALNIGPASGSGDFILRRSTSYSGDIKPSQQVTVRGDSHNTVVTAASPFSNAGAIHIESGPGSGQLIVSGGPLVNLPGGTIDFSGTAFMELRADLTNQGTISVDGNASIGTTAKNHLNSGTIAVSATATFLGTSFTNQVGGLITGDGGLNVSAIAFANDGQIAPGAAIGDLTVTGSAPFGSTAILAIELGGTTPATEYDRLVVSGTVDLDGNLSVSLVNGFAPITGDTFEIISTAGGVNGMFNKELLPDGYLWDVDYNATTVSLEVLALLGDMNADDNITPADAPLFIQALVDRAAYDAAFPLVDADVIGDINQNGTFDLGDIAEFNQLFASPASAETVPEPTTGSLAVILVMTMAIRRRLCVWIPMLEKPLELMAACDVRAPCARSMSRSWRLCSRRGRRHRGRQRASGLRIVDSAALKHHPRRQTARL